MGGMRPLGGRVGADAKPVGCANDDLRHGRILNKIQEPE